MIGFLATVIPEKLASQELDASTEASGPHVFAVRFRAFRQGHLRVHRSPPRVRDVRERPSGRDGMTILCHTSHFWKSEIFSISSDFWLDTISVNRN